MIPRSQHFGDRSSFPLDGTGIMRIFEKPRIEALFLSAGGRAHYAGEHSNASVEDGHRAKLSARQDIVADADRLDVTRLEDPLVEPLEPPAQQDRTRTGGKVAHPRLGQGRPARGKRQHWPPI